MNQNVKSKKSRLTQWITFTAIAYCTFAYGCGFTFLAPTVIDFSKKFNTEVNQVSLVFTVLTACFALGAFTYGILSNFFRRQIIVISLLSIMLAALLSIPQASTLAVFYFLSGCLGFGSGGYEAAQISWTIDIWLNDAAPFIQIQYFAFAVGTVVPPLLLAPFLTSDPNDSTTIKSTMKIVNIFNSPSLQNTSESQDLAKKTNLLIPFLVAASIIALGIFIQLVLFFKLKSKSILASTKVTSEDENPNSSNEAPTGNQLKDSHSNSKRRTIFLVFLSCSVVGIYQGMELTTTQFLPTFAVYADVGISEAKGADILFGLTLAFAISRGLGILIVLKVAPHFILFGNIVLLIVSNLFLLFFAQNSVTMLWIGSVIVGIAMSTACPSAYAFIENHLHVTDRIASTIVVTAGTVSAISPLLVGTSVQYNPSILCYVNLGSISALMLGFGTLYWFVEIKKSNKC